MTPFTSFLKFSATTVKRRLDPFSLNDSKLNTVIVLAVTSTMKYGELPGNVVLRKGEANLKEKGMVNVTQIESVDKRSVQEEVGTLSEKRMAEVYEGIRLIMNIP